MRAVLKRCANSVMACLGKGHTERIYHRAMVTALNKLKIAHRSEVLAPIYYMKEVVGFGRCDIVVDRFIVEFKANMRPPSHTSPQLRKYMESLKESERQRFSGVVINFNQRTGKVNFWAQTKRKRKQAKK